MKKDFKDLLWLLAAGVWGVGVLWSISNHSCIGGAISVCIALGIVIWIYNKTE
jgi:hypothetical protein